MLTALSSPLGLKALSLVPTQQQWPRLSALINQLHHQNMVFKKTKNILELKSYREQKRSLNFLSFISKKVKNYPRFLGISTINFFPNKCLKKRQRKPLWRWGKKGKRWDKVYLLAQECHFLQPASYTGKGVMSFAKTEQTLRMSNLFAKKEC